MPVGGGYHRIKKLPREELKLFVTENIKSLTEDEALAVIENPYVTTGLLQSVAHSQRLTGYYSVRLRLVAHRQTPQAHSVKLIHYIYWFDLVRLSVDMTIPAPVRRAIDTQLLLRADKLTLGERIATARRCSSELIKIFLKDTDTRVFSVALLNQRVREDDVLAAIAAPSVTAEQLRLIADNPKWSYRYAVRKALVLHPLTPRSASATQLRYLTRRDRRLIHQNPATSTYLRRCIERLDAKDFSAHAERIE